MSNFSNPFIPALNLLGLIAPAAKCYFYLTDTSTLAPVYADADLTTPLDNPVVANINGRLPDIYIDDATIYRVRLETALGALIDEIDPFSSSLSNLASIAPSKGAGLIGFDWFNTYANGTLGSALNLLNQQSDGGFWTGWNTVTSGLPLPPGDLATGGRAQRIQDRIFIGGATANSGDFPSTTKDWLEQFEADRSHPLGFRTSWAQFASLSTTGGIAVLGAVRSSDSNLPTFQLGMGGCFTAINDNTVNQQLVTAMYAVAFRRPGAGTISHTGTTGGEIDIANEGAVIQVTPGDVYKPSFTVALQLNSGAVSPFATTASHALSIGNNGANFNTGVIFAQNALAGLTYDGTGKATSGTASAMRLGAFQQMEWWTYPFSAASFVISSEQLTAANAQSIKAKDTGIFLGGEATAGLALQTVYPGGATGAWFAVTPATGSAPPTISITGGGANQNLRLQPKGTGTISFGTYVNTPSAIAGYITIADDGGTARKIAIVS